MKPLPEGRCGRCQQTRPLFEYKPQHDCIETIGRVDLIEGAQLAAEIDESGDRWCTRRIEREKPLLVCIRCHDTEHADEAEFIEEREL